MTYKRSSKIDRSSTSLVDKNIIYKTKVENNDNEDKHKTRTTFGYRIGNNAKSNVF